MLSTRFFGMFFIVLAIISTQILVAGEENTNHNKFRQLTSELPTPNVYRTASGAPGPQYYQQKADYRMFIELDDNKQRIVGKETITYHNNSPEALSYLWLQLDQNVRAEDSDAMTTETSTMKGHRSFTNMHVFHQNFDGGFKIDYVQDAQNQNVPFTIVKTMMRVDLKTSLQSGSQIELNIGWWYNINDREKISGRSGMEYFPGDGNYIYTIAQFFPRMAVYNDVEGWQTKTFLGSAEFALNFGDYHVEITAPADHVIAATGELQNAAQVLTVQQQKRLQEARLSDTPLKVVTEAEARDAEKSRSKLKKTWIFEAKNVRDFAFASSRKFLWDAMGVSSGTNQVMAMAFYPKEGNPLWEEYATRVVAHTLQSYSKYTFDYPWPTAQVVHTKNIGMEYPMICFTGRRPEENGNYSNKLRDAMISVIIHEIGHNYFPMIVNSDERRWAWMDEGLNSFLQYLTEQSWQAGFPSRRGPAHKVFEYMQSDKSDITPIMTDAESILHLGANAYAKPATALNILRESILGRDLFDFAFREYAQRWEFKHPTPADFFRTMEDASGIDLDWFWRGWFFTTDYVDLAISNARLYKIYQKEEDSKKRAPSTFRNSNQLANKDVQLIEGMDLAFPVTFLEEIRFADQVDALPPAEQKHWKEYDYYYELTIENRGGLIMPLVLLFEFRDGTTEKKTYQPKFGGETMKV